MAQTAEITEALIRENISRAVTEVFETMLHFPVAYREFIASHPHEPVRPAPPQNSQVVGTVGFLGELNGLIYLYFDETFACKCAGQMLGMSEAEVNEGGTEVVNDVIGEMTNMIVGSFKNRLCDVGLPCKLTVPSILRGSNFRIEATGDARRFIYIFEGLGSRIVADILMTQDQ